VIHRVIKKKVVILVVFGQKLLRLENAWK